MNHQSKYYDWQGYSGYSDPGSTCKSVSKPNVKNINSTASASNNKEMKVEYTANKPELKKSRRK